MTVVTQLKQGGTATARRDVTVPAASSRVSPASRARRPASGTVRFAAAMISLFAGAVPTFVAAQAATGSSAPPTVVIAMSPHADPVLGEMIDLKGGGAARDLLFDLKLIPSHDALHRICRGARDDPRIAMTTRGLPAGLAKDCAPLIKGELVAIELGRDPIILAVRSEAGSIALTPNQIYQALARDVPAGDEFRRNVSIRWSDIDRSLPPIDIRFQLPPGVDHRRHIFNGLVLEDGCRIEGHIKSIYEANQRTARCVTTRIDRVREVARDHALRTLLDAPVGTIGVIGLNDLVEADGKLVAVALNGVTPTRAAIQEGSYGFAASQWLFIRRDSAEAHADPRIDRELARLARVARSEEMIGPRGKLMTTGLVPLADDEREAQRAALTANEQGYDLAWFASWVTSAFTSTWSMFGQTVSNLRETKPINKVDLAKLMDTAGYKLAEIESDVGLIPGAGMTFKITREMSEADRDFLERELYKDARARPDFRSALQRRLIRAIVEISESDGYQVSKVDVTLLPLPSVKLSITPSGGGGSDTATVLRAIERLEERLSEAMR